MVSCRLPVGSSMQKKAAMAKKSFTERLIRRAYYKYFSRNVLYELQIRARSEAADYISEYLATAVLFEKHEKMLQFCVEKSPEGAILEFGVAGGESLNIIARAAKERPVHGFDSFEGLPEDWTGHLEMKGAFSQGGKMPKVEPNVTLHKGWFDDTLPEWAKRQNGKVAFLHIDCDLYSSTMTVLNILKDRLQIGTVINFDEYLNYPGWREHEYKAWQDFTADHKISYQYIAFGAHNGPAAVQITAFG